MTGIDMYAYFDDIEGHAEILQIELSITEPSSEHADALKDRIRYLQERITAGDAWVDNDTTASPDAWETLQTYTENEAIQQYKEWDN